MHINVHLWLVNIKPSPPIREIPERYLQYSLINNHHRYVLQKSNNHMQKKSKIKRNRYVVYFFMRETVKSQPLSQCQFRTLTSVIG